jgi:hypothetical protein
MFMKVIALIISHKNLVTLLLWSYFRLFTLHCCCLLLLLLLLLLLSPFLVRIARSVRYKFKS